METLVGEFLLTKPFREKHPETKMIRYHLNWFGRDQKLKKLGKKGLTLFERSINYSKVKSNTRSGRSAKEGTKEE